MQNLADKILLTGIISHDQLKEFYDNLPGKLQDNFRHDVMSVLDWSYPVWRNKIKGITHISRLEAYALANEMKRYETKK